MASLKILIKTLLTVSLARKVIAMLLLILALYFFRDFAFVFFMTFILSFLFLALWDFIRNKIDFFLDKVWYPEDNNVFFRKNFSVNFFIVVEYMFFLMALFFLFTNLIPQVVKELSWLVKTVPFFESQIQNIHNELIQIINFNKQLEWTLQKFISSWDYWMVLNVLEKIRFAWVIFFKFFLSVVLSFVFLMDRRRLRKYLEWIKKSNFYFLYDEYKNIILKISKSFGLIIRAQSLISFINTILTLIWLLVIGKVYSDTWSFPYILTFWLVVFVFWFIPVLGVFLSSIPMIIVAYTFWGWHASLAIVLLVTIVHMVEAYYLNPKIVSSYFELPVSLTFVILIVSEHLFGFAGLLIWVSLFYFVMSILEDADKVIFRKRKKLELLSKAEKKLNKECGKCEK